MKILSLSAVAVSLVFLTNHAVRAEAVLEAWFPLDGDLNPGGVTSYTATAVGANAPKFTTGILGSAGDFDNNNAGSTPSDWAATLGNVDLLYENDFSISLWVRTTSTGGGALMGNSNWLSGANTGWLLSTFTGGRQGKVKTSTGTRQNQTINLSTGNWHLVTLVVDNTNDRALWYLDAVLLNGAGAAMGSGTLGAGLGTMIGGSGGGVESGAADLDDVAIFSGLLTPSQISYLYNGGTGRTADQFNGAPVPKEITWSGAAGSEWSTNAIASPKNWLLTSNGTTRADFVNLDTVRFNDSPANTTVTISQGDVSPGLLAFANGSKNYTLTGTNGLTGGVELQKSGAGRLTLANPNLHTGATLINDGPLVISHPSALLNSTLTAFASTGATHAFGPLTEATLGGLSGDGPLTLTGSTAQPLALTAGGNNADTVHSGNIGGTGSLTKTGSGRLALAGTNTFNGGITVAAGSLQSQQSGAFPAGQVVSTGGTIEFAVPGGTETTVANNFLLPDTGTGVARMFAVFADGGAAPTPGTTVRLSGKISGGTAARTFRFSDTGLTSEHDNVLILDNAANDFTGVIELYRATLAITSDAALGNPDNDLIHFSENLLGRIRFDSDNIVLNDQRFISLPGTANNRPFDTRNFTATLAGPISGTGNLVKQGTGRLILTSNDTTFSGAINIAAGTLEVAGTLPFASPVITVAAAGRLTGTGSIQRDVAVNGGTLSAGPGIATLGELTNVSVADASRFEVEITNWTGTAGVGYDTITAASLNLTATAFSPATVVLTPFNLTNFTDNARTFTLVSTLNGISGFVPEAFVVDASALPQASALQWWVEVRDNDLVLVYGAPTVGFSEWIAGKNLSGVDSAFEADPDHDGIANGMEFVLGGEPNPVNPNANSTALLPIAVSDGTYLRVTFRRNTQSIPLNPLIQYDTDLIGGWTPAVHGTGGVIVNTTLNIAPAQDLVEVLIPRSLAVNGRLFARLAVAQ